MHGMRHQAIGARVKPSDDPTLSRMRWARGEVARLLGVEELPPDAEVECGLGRDGVLHVVGTVTAKGTIHAVEVTVRLDATP